MFFKFLNNTKLGIVFVFIGLLIVWNRIFTEATLSIQFSTLGLVFYFFSQEKIKGQLHNCDHNHPAFCQVIEIYFMDLHLISIPILLWC